MSAYFTSKTIQSIPIKYGIRSLH